jgi:hypothetical protein
MLRQEPKLMASGRSSPTGLAGGSPSHTPELRTGPRGAAPTALRERIGIVKQKQIGMHIKCRTAHNQGSARRRATLYRGRQAVYRMGRGCQWPWPIAVGVRSLRRALTVATARTPERLSRWWGSCGRRTRANGPGLACVRVSACVRADEWRPFGVRGGVGTLHASRGAPHSGELLGELVEQTLDLVERHRAILAGGTGAAAAVRVPSGSRDALTLVQ